MMLYIVVVFNLERGVLRRVMTYLRTGMAARAAAAAAAAAGRHRMVDALQVVLVVEDLLVAAARAIFDVVHGAHFALGLDVDLLRQDLHVYIYIYG